MPPSRTVKGIAAAATVTFALVACCRTIVSETRPVPPRVLPDAGPQPAALAVSPPAPPPRRIVLPPFTMVLADPRVTSAEALVRAGSYAAAADELDRLRTTLPLTAHEKCTWAYTTGRLRFYAKDLDGAASRFDEAAEVDGGTCPLAPYARFRAGEAYAALGRTEAFDRLRAVGADLPVHDDAQLTLANALAAHGDRKEAIELWDQLLTANDHRARWTEIATHLAAALLAEPASQANESRALELLTRVLLESPKSPEAAMAAPLRAKAEKALKARGQHIAEKAKDELSSQQAKSVGDAGVAGDAGDTKKAAALADAMRKHPAPPPTCPTALAAATAATRQRAYSLWGAALAACKGSEDLPIALYRAARSSLQMRKPDEALSRFAEIEQRFPKHRLADDARLRRASILLEQGHAAEALALMDSVAETYPEGDMHAEADFRAGLVRFKQGALERAAASFDKSDAESADDHSVGTAGRARYFRARVALAAGDPEGAKERLSSVIQAAPLTYPMLLAWTRLRALDPELARSALAGIDVAPKEMPDLRLEDWVGDPRLLRFIALLETPDGDASRLEGASIQSAADESSAPLLWLVGYYYNAAGEPDLGHILGRTRSDYLAAGPRGIWRFAWEVAYPQAYAATVFEESRAGGADPGLVFAIMREESAFKADAKSGANAHGLMQLIPSTARMVSKNTTWPSDVAALEQPEVSIALGARLLGTLEHDLPPLPFAIASYNAGAGVVRKWVADAPEGADLDVWVEDIPYEETRVYVKHVLASMAAYEFLYDREHFEEVMALPLAVR